MRPNVGQWLVEHGKDTEYLMREVDASEDGCAEVS